MLVLAERRRARIELTVFLSEKVEALSLRVALSDVVLTRGHGPVGKECGELALADSLHILPIDVRLIAEGGELGGSA